MTQLHFQPIKGKALGIIDALLHTEEVALMEGKMQRIIRLVIEELVANVVSYAYPDDTDDYLDVEIIRDETSITLRFRDGGVPFNPLDVASPDIKLPMEQRKIGGLGIFLVINKMDTVDYEYTRGENVLTLKKCLDV